jgi:NADH-quinone oxidoreductase subunit C/D
MTTGSALYIPPYKADDQDVVVELNNRFGAEAFTAQPTRTGMPVLWVARPARRSPDLPAQPAQAVRHAL